MDSKFITMCIFCGNQNLSTLDWIETNKLVFCETCCKSYEPVDKVKYNPRYDDSLSKDFYSSEEDESDDGWASGDGWEDE